VLAGRDASSSVLTATEIYQPATDTWREGLAVPTGRSGVAAAVLGTRVYLFGGESLGPSSTFEAAERYDPVADRWETMPPMPTARHGLGAASLDGRIHVISGGPEAGLTFSDVHEVLEPAD
jgi:N-acetylneuraminic acid mutarotase